MSSADANFAASSTTRWELDVARNVAKLASAAGVSCLLTIATAPLLTRVYSPDDLGIYGAFTAILFVVSASTSLRYEFAIPIADSDDDARSLVYLAMAVLVVFTAIACAGIGACLIAGPERLAIKQLSAKLWLFPPAMFALGTFQILYYQLVRARRFSDLATIGLARYGSESIMHLVLGLLAFGAAGLIGGTIVSYIVGAGALLAVRATRGAALFDRSRLQPLIQVAVQYRRYAVYSTPSSICNAAGAYLPSLLVAIYYGPENAGWLLLADRVFALPSRIVGRAVSDVYFGEAARCLRECPHQLVAMIRQSTKVLVIAASGVFVVALASGPAFVWAFGGQWREAGIYAQILAAPFAVRFLVLAITQLTTYGLNHWQLGWDVLRLVGACVPLLVCAALGLSARAAIAWYGVTTTILFVVLYGLNVLAVNYTVRRRLQLIELEARPL
ncbi:MAG: lipopolysaccharide biosynthesis protein [Pirellulales bacterium]